MFSGNETLCGLDGYGVGTCTIINTGCMSHGNLGDETHGLSKAIAMGLVLIVCPLKESEPMDFEEAWYAIDMRNIKTHHSTILSLLNYAVSQNFWVRKSGLG